MYLECSTPSLASASDSKYIFEDTVEERSGGQAQEVRVQGPLLRLTLQVKHGARKNRARALRTVAKALWRVGDLEPTGIKFDRKFRQMRSLAGV
jgi:hypothetical protein